MQRVKRVAEVAAIAGQLGLDQGSVLGGRTPEMFRTEDPASFSTDASPAAIVNEVRQLELRRRLVQQQDTAFRDLLEADRQKLAEVSASFVFVSSHV